MRIELTRRRALSMVLAVALAAAHAWAQAALPLGLSESAAREGFFESVDRGSPAFRSNVAKAFVALPAAGRAAAVDAGFAWAKRHTASEAFTSAYARTREERMPIPPEFERTVDDELKQQLEKETADRAQMLAALPAEQRAQMETVFTQLAAQQQDPQMVALRRQGIEADRAREQQNYQENLTHWETNMPADPLVLVGRRLRAFLDVSADVNYAAELVTVGSLRRFADPALESKPGEWKSCYRAGKEAVTAARTHAQEWLETLPAQ